MMGDNLPFYTYKAQSEVPLRKRLKNMKIPRCLVSKQLFILQIAIQIEVQIHFA